MEQEQESAQEFSFYEMLVYCLRKWFVILLAAIIGAGCALAYIIAASTKKDAVMYDATIWVADISKFFPTAVADKDTQAIYSSQASRALDIMTTETVKNIVYSKVKGSLMADKKNEPDSESAIERDFFHSLSVARGAYFITVRYGVGSASREDEELCKYIVSTYTAEAIKAAAADTPKFGEAGILIPSEPYRNFNVSSFAEKTQSAITSLAIGVLGGACLGFLLTVAIYFCDKKVKAFSAIGVICHERMLGCGKIEDLAPSYPMLDKVMTENNKKVLLLASAANGCLGYAEKFSEYTVLSSRKTLFIAPCKDAALASAEVFSGDLAANVIAEDGVDTLRYCDADVKKILPNADKIKKFCGGYDRVIVDAKYASSGSMACFGVIADSYVVVFDQTQTTKKEIFAIAEEIDAIDKSEGAIICNPGKGFVAR